MVKPAMGVVGWGICGCGWVARDYAAPAILDSHNGELIALHDPSATALATIVHDHREIIRTTDYDVFLRTPGLHAVYVAAPIHLHRRWGEAAAASGHAVLCEKPMALHADDAQAMVAACARHDVFYATAFDQRFHAAHQHAAKMLAGGAIGRVAAVRIAYACWVGSGWSGDNWRIDPARAGGGAFFDLAPHGLDLAATLLGEPIASAYAIGQFQVQDYAREPGGVDDGAMVVARTDSGVLLQLHVAYNCPEFLPRRRLEILGERGQITLTDTMGQTPGGTLLLHTANGVAQEIMVPGIEHSPFTRQIAAFGDQLLGVAAYGFEPEQDLRTMDLLVRLRDAIASGRSTP